MSKTRPIHVLHIIHGLTIGGAEVDLLHKSRQLVQHYGYAMTICCLMRRGDLASQFEAAGIAVVGPLMRHRYDLVAALKLRQIINQPQWDVVHTHLSAANRLGWLVNLSLLQRRKPLLASEHAMAERWNWFVLAWDRMIVRTGVTLVVPSQAAAASYTAHGIPHHALTVLANGIDLQPFRSLDYNQLRARTRQMLGLQEDAFVIGTVSRLEAVKNIPLLFEATVPLSAQLVVIGDGSQRPKLEQLIVTQGWQDKIHLVGSKMNIPQWLAAFDLFVLASSSESFGIVVAEALLMEIPVVASHVGGIPEITGNGAYATLITSADPQSLHEAIRWSMEHYEQAKAMARGGKEYVEKMYSCETSAAGLDAIYSEFLTNSFKPSA